MRKCRHWLSTMKKWKISVSAQKTLTGRTLIGIASARDSDRERPPACLPSSHNPLPIEAFLCLGQNSRLRRRTPAFRSLAAASRRRRRRRLQSGVVIRPCLSDRDAAPKHDGLVAVGRTVIGRCRERRGSGGRSRCPKWVCFDVGKLSWKVTCLALLCAVFLKALAMLTTNLFWEDIAIFIWIRRWPWNEVSAYFNAGSNTSFYCILWDCWKISRNRSIPRTTLKTKHWLCDQLCANCVLCTVVVSFPHENDSNLGELLRVQ